MAKKLFGCLLLLGLALGAVLVMPVEISAAGKRKPASKGLTIKRSGKRSVIVKRGSGKSSRLKQSIRSSNRAKQARRSGSRREAMMSANGRYGRRIRGYRRISGPASAMPSDRVREIQDALKREGFFVGEPTGQYDKATVDAMTSYQKSHNFRATGYPTAEVLQALGLTKNRVVAPSVPTSAGEADTQTQTKSQMQVPSPEAERNNR